MNGKKPERVLIICNNHLRTAPRFLMEVNALKEHYTVMAAGLSGDSSESSDYQFIDISYHGKFPERSGKSMNITFHLKWPVFLRKIASFFIRAIFYSSLEREKDKTAEILRKHEFNILKNYDFDILLVHHLNALPLTDKLAKLKKVKVIFNAHEYYPRELEDVPLWLKYEQPKRIALGKKHLTRMNAILVVGENIAREYKKEFGVDSLVIKNSKRLEYLKPSSFLKGKIRIIHHGGLIRSRGLEEMVKMMGLLGENYHLDMMLTLPNTWETVYLDEFKKLAENYKNVSLLPTVPTNEIPKTINNYDIGCFILQPTNFNYLNALPNKLFEFIQARLAIAVSPSPEMADIVKKYDLGIVAKDFTAASMAEEIKKLTAEKLMYHKSQCDKYAFELSAATEEKLILQTVNSLLEK